MAEKKADTGKSTGGRKSYYRTINGKKYDRALLEKAEELTAQVDGGELSAADARKLLEESQDAGKVTAVEKATMEYVQNNYAWAAAEPAAAAEPEAAAETAEEPAASTSDAATEAPEEKAGEADATAGADQTEEASTASAAMTIVNKHAAYAGAVGLIPVPVIDLAGITAVQVRMLRELAHLYGDQYRNHIGKHSVGQVLGLLTTHGLAAPVASLLKAIPVAGGALGSAGLSATAVATTTALGKVFINHWEGGGSYTSFDAKAARADYAAAFKRSKAS